MAKRKNRLLGTTNILGRIHTVERVADIKRPESEIIYEGFLVHKDRRIYISARPQIRGEDELCLHEILHAIAMALGLSLSEQSVASLARSLWLAGVRWSKRKA